MVDLWVSYVTIGFGSFKKMSASSFAFFVMQKAKKIFMTLDKSGKLDQPEFSSCYIFLCVAKLKNAWIMIKSIVSFTFFWAYKPWEILSKNFNGKKRWSVSLKKIFSTVSKACMGVHYLAFFVSLSFTFLISVGFIFSWICQVFHHERIWHLIVKKSVGKVAVLMSKAELENWSWPWRKVACFGEFCFIHIVAEFFNISSQKWRILWGVWSSVLWSVRWPAGASKDALLPLT